LVLFWFCFGFVLVLFWFCFGFVLVLFWFCFVFVLFLQPMLLRLHFTYLRPPRGRPMREASARVSAPALLAATCAERLGLAK
jgi:hypothetical protein